MCRTIYGIMESMRHREEIEARIRKLLGIPQHERISSLSTDVIRGKVYYKVITYSYKDKRAYRYRVRKRVEKEVLALWKELREIREKEKEVKEKAVELFRQDPELLKFLLQKLL